MQELAERFKVGHTTLWKWTHKPGFPASLGYRIDRLPEHRATRGRYPEVWESKAVEQWLSDRKRARVELARSKTDEYAQLRRQRERARNELVKTVRRLVKSGEPLRSIAAETGTSYTFVRSIAHDIGHPRRPSTRLRKKISDEELLTALKASGVRTMYAYEKWRAGQPNGVPASSTIATHFGTWREALKRVDVSSRKRPAKAAKSRSRERAL